MTAPDSLAAGVFRGIGDRLLLQLSRKPMTTTP
jgi:hypothetical protein